MSIAVYSGSFDPLHIGHVTFIKETLKSGFVDRILVVPTKDYWDKKMHSSVEERIQAIESLGLENVMTDMRYTVFDYTYELMRFVQSEYPDEVLFLMLGADNLLHFDKWRNFQELLGYRLIIMNRGCFDVKELMGNLGSDNYVLLDCERVDVSSSYIRRYPKRSQHLVARGAKK